MESGMFHAATANELKALLVTHIVPAVGPISMMTENVKAPQTEEHDKNKSAAQELAKDK